MSDIVEVESIAIQDLDEEEYLDVLNNLLSSFLHQAPQHWDLSFVRQAHQILKNHNAPTCMWVNQFLEDEKIRDRYLALKERGRC